VSNREEAEVLLREWNRMVTTMQQILNEPS
jgi:hypothetical protein